MNSDQLVRAAQKHLDSAAKTADAKVEDRPARDEDGVLLDAMHRLLRERAAQTNHFKLFVMRAEAKFDAVEKLLRDVSAKIGDLQARVIELESTVEEHGDSPAVSTETIREVTKVLGELSSLVRQHD